MRKDTSIIILNTAIALGMFLIVSCSASKPTPIETSTPLLATLETKTPMSGDLITQEVLPKTATPTLSITPTYGKRWTQAPPSPTLAYELQDQLYALLKTNGDCELPCFLGITPGKTAWVDAESFLLKYDRNSRFTPEVHGRSPSTNFYYSQIFTGKDIDLNINLTLEVENGLVQRIVMDSTPTREGCLVGDDEHYSYYSLHNAFLQMGVPDFIYILPPDWSAGYAIDIVYLEQKVIIEYGGRSTENETGYTLCPNIGDGDIMGITLVLANPTDPLDIRKYGPIDMRGHDQLNFEGEKDFTIDQVTDMNTQEFYNLIIQSEKPCFVVKTK